MRAVRRVPMPCTTAEDVQSTVGQLERPRGASQHCPRAAQGTASACASQLSPRRADAAIPHARPPPHRPPFKRVCVCVCVSVCVGKLSHISPLANGWVGSYSCACIAATTRARSLIHDAFAPRSRGGGPGCRWHLLQRRRSDALREQGSNPHPCEPCTLLAVS